MPQTHVHKGNKGEWGEFYTSLKVALDGFLQGVGGDLSPLIGRRLKVLQVVRTDYLISTDNGVLFYRNESGEIRGQVLSGRTSLNHHESRSQMATRVKNLLFKINAIETGKPETQPSADPDVSSFMERIGCQYLSMSSESKKDILLQIVDPMAGGVTDYGFSIKSYLGGPPTLMNSSGQTSLEFEVKNADLVSLADIEEIKSTSGKLKYKRMMDYLVEKGARLEFSQYDGKTFELNLMQLDDGLPRIFAKVVQLFEETGSGNLDSIFQKIEECDPAQYGGQCLSFYRRKFKRFLVASALGMRPETLWEDIDDATGGFLIVKPDGELVAFYITDRQKFEDYLMASTNLQHPTSSRVQRSTGLIKNPNRVWLFEQREVNGAMKLYVHFNLQIRFSKV